MRKHNFNFKDTNTRVCHNNLSQDHITDALKATVHHSQGGLIMLELSKIQIQNYFQ
jgi:hypothetical protein